MAKKWSDVRAEAVQDGLLEDRKVAEHEERMLAEARAYKLAAIRSAYGVKQEELAARLHVSQSRVSRTERGQLDQSQLSTLRAYVEALGGELEVSARFGDERITLG